MLHPRIVALACLAMCPSIPALAEPSKTGTTPSASHLSDKSAPVHVAAAEETANAPVTPAPSSSTPPAAAAAVANEAEKAEVKPAPLPKPTLTVSVDLGSQRMVVSQRGQVIHSWPISSGTASHPTPRGTFRPQWTAKMWNSRKYDMAPMPHSVFIHGGIAIHGTGHLSALGRPASHGCIRLAPGHAKTFYNLVHRHGLKATKVSVHGSPRYPAVANNRMQQQPRYASNQGFSFWDWGSSEPVSAYNPQFTKKHAKKYQPSQKKGQRNAKQRPPSKAYSYNNSYKSYNRW